MPGVPLRAGPCCLPVLSLNSVSASFPLLSRHTPKPNLQILVGGRFPASSKCTSTAWVGELVPAIRCNSVKPDVDVARMGGTLMIEVYGMLLCHPSFRNRNSPVISNDGPLSKQP